MALTWEVIKGAALDFYFDFQFFFHLSGQKEEEKEKGLELLPYMM